MKSLNKQRVLAMLLGLGCLALTGCNANVGVGMSIGVPIGDHGYISVGGGNWH